MKKHWNPLRGIRRSFGKRSRLGNVIFKRCTLAGFEPLELRALLSADALSNASAWYSSANVDAHATSLSGLSVRSMLASCNPTAPSPAAPSSSVSTASIMASMSTSTSAPVVNPPADALPSLSAAPAINASPLDATDQVEYRLEAEDGANNPITSISVGQEFQLAVFVHDIRPTPNPSGVFAGFLNVAYNNALATIDTTATPTFGPTFTQAGASFDFSTPGTIAHTGSFGTSIVSLGTAEQLLFRVTVHAVGGGAETFTPSFDATAGHDTLVLGNDNPVLVGDIQFDPLTLTVGDTLSISNASGAEGNSALNNNLEVFTATLANASIQAVTVNFATADGTATTADNDYLATSGTLTFAPGATTQFVTVAVKGDTTHESDETFAVNLSAPTNATLGTPSVGQGTISNDDPVPTISVGTVSLPEGNAATKPFVFTVSLSNANSTPVTVQFNTADGTATVADNDYVAGSGTLTFAPGATTQFVTVAVNGDTTHESDETFAVNLSAPTNATLDATPGQGLGTITNDDPVPTISVGTVTLSEGNANTTAFVFTVSLSNANSTPVTVQFNTADGTATVADNDYVAGSGTLTFAPGATTQFVTVAVTGDTIHESNEAFAVNLSAPTNATLAATPGQGLGTINNDDPVPTISVGTVTLPEGNANTTNFVFTVSLSNPNSTPITVEFNTADGTATTADDDYVAGSGTLTFAPGVTSQLVTVLVNGDTANEGNETFKLELANPTSATLDVTPGQGLGTIVNDDGPHLLFSPPTVSQLETDSSTTMFVFTVSIVVPDPDNPVTVAFTTQDGTATVADSDYIATSGTLTFAPTTTTQTITVLVNGDAKFEGDETFKVVLSGPSANATISESTAVGTILNDDVPPTISFVDDTVSQPEGNTVTSNMLFTVQLSAASGQAVTVQFSTVDGTATTADSDYGATSGTLTFAPGLTSMIVTVPIIGDSKNEADETFTLKLLNSTNASNATETAVTATGTIQNDDPLPILSIENQTGFEGNSLTSNMVFTVSLSAASGQMVTAAYATSDGSATTGGSAATGGNDYAATSGTLTFAPGVTSQFITVAINGDLLNETSETFNVDLSAATNATPETSTGVGTIANDDAAPTLSINNFSHVEGNATTTDFLFTVSLSAASGQAVSVNFATAPITAATGTDFVGQSAVLTFAPGTTQQIITVAVNGDTLNEADETFTVNLSAASNATIASGTGTGTIQNDDPLPTLSIGNFSHLEGDSGTTPFVFVVNLSTLSGQTVTVTYATADGTATTANSDYVATSGTLTFGAGVTTQNITVSVVGDLFLEPDETFVVNLSAATNATIQTAQGTGTIQNETTDNISFTPSTLSGFAFIDSNVPHDLSKGGSEPVLPGVAVTLTGTSSISNLPVTKQAVTDASGAYTFAGLDPGTYTVTFAQPQQFKDPQVVVNTAGAQVLGNGALGFTTTIGSLGGVHGTGNNLAVRAKLDSLISQRDFLSSTHTTVTAASIAAAPSALAASSASSGASSSITQSGSIITVHGTAGDDVFEFQADAHTFKINGVTHSFDPSSVSEVDFDGAGGSDMATLTGSAGDDVVSAGLGSATFSGAHFKVNVSNVASLSINGGGGHDTGTLQDSVRSDALNAVGDEVSIANDLGFATSLAAFAQVKARATLGGSDTAHVGAIDFALEQEGTWLSA